MRHFEIILPIKHAKNRILGYENHRGCYICTSFVLDKKGYYRTNYENKDMRLHKIVFLHYNGLIPEGKIIRHTCDDDRCINPEHLILGTHRDNMRDRDEHGRTKKGNQCKNSKLNNSKVAFIRVHRELSNKELASFFKVSVSAITDVRNRRTWNHLDEHSIDIQAMELIYFNRSVTSEIQTCNRIAA